MQFRHIFRRASYANPLSRAVPCPAKNESEAKPNNVATRWIPGVDVFFVSLVHVIRGARSHLPTNQVDSAEFRCRPLDEYERTLTLLLSRVEESRPDQETFPQVLQMLTPFLRNLKDMLDSRTFRREFSVEREEIPQSLCTNETPWRFTP